MPTTEQLIKEALKEFDKWFNHGTKKEPRFAYSSGAYKEVRDFFKQQLSTIATQSAKEAFEEVITFRSPYVYDEYSTLYQKSNEIRYEYFDDENKFLNEKLEDLSQPKELND